MVWKPTLILWYVYLSTVLFIDHSIDVSAVVHPALVSLVLDIRDDVAATVNSGRAELASALLQTPPPLLCDFFLRG